VKSAAPQASESIKWAQPVDEDHGPFAYIKAFPRSVNFGFWRGIEIDAGRGRLESSGTRMGHVKLHSVADIDARLLSEYVKQAVELNRLNGDSTKTR
jgi:hypothetical protein